MDSLRVSPVDDDDENDSDDRDDGGGCRLPRDMTNADDHQSYA